MMRRYTNNNISHYRCAVHGAPDCTPIVLDIINTSVAQTKQTQQQMPERTHVPPHHRYLILHKSKRPDPEVPILTIWMSVGKER